MASIETLGPGDFGKGTKKRLPICFCLDVSGSMQGARIVSLNNALKAFFDTIKENTDATASVDVAIITYGGIVDVFQGFSPISKVAAPVVSERKRSYTPMGEGILTSLRLLEMRKQAYKDRGLKYYQPWLVLITDGKPEGPNAEEAFENAVRNLNEMEAADKVVVFNIGVGEDADMDSLRRVSVKREYPIRADEKNLSSYFQFLGSSSTNVVKGGDVSQLYQEIVEKEGIAPDDNEFDISKWVKQ
ncbi:MAG: VWA domain-containing protein [Clostridia bacterium]|jgi:uncharacterized protein YegL|nr:VWA domain-containing protein [Clostridia bacterium]